MNPPSPAPVPSLPPATRSGNRRQWRRMVRTLSRVMPMVMATQLLLSCALVEPPQIQQPSVQQSTSTGKRISSVKIQYTGEKTVDEARLMNLIHLKKGGVSSPWAWDESIKDLYESGLVDDASMREEADGDRVRVIVQVQTRPRLGPSLHLIGNSIFSDQKLLKHGFACCAPGIAMNKVCVEQASRRMENFYRRQGYPATRVSVPQDHPWIRQDPYDPASYDSCVILVEEGQWTMAGQDFSSVRTRRGR